MNENKRKKKPRWQEYIFFAVMILIGGVCGWMTTCYMDGFVNDGVSMEQELLMLAVTFVQIFVAMYLQTMIHEAGHLIFGLCSGYRFLSFRVGSFMWVKQDGKVRLKRLTIAGTGGQCLMAPPDMVDGKIPVFLYNLGGSFMNFISAILCLLLHFICGPSSMAGVFFMLMALFGLVGALSNGIPINTGTITNDGYNAMSLRKNPEALRAFWIQMKMCEKMSAGVRIKDMPDEWFYIPSEEAMKNSLVASIGVFTCNRFMDALRFEEADEHMERLLCMENGIIGLHRSMLICDRIFCELVGEKRPERLEEMLNKQQKKFMKSMKTYPSILRTQYAYALLYEKDMNKAEKIKQQFEKYARTYPYPGEITGERELMKTAENHAVDGDI